MEQSPCEEKLSESAVSQLGASSARHGTIVGEALSSFPHCLTSSITMVQPAPPAVLSFRDQTVCPTDSRTAGPGWEVYSSPEQPASQTPRPETSLRPKGEPFKIMEDSEQPGSPQRAQEPADVPMSPEGAVRPDWLHIASPAVTAEPDLDAFLSPCRRPEAGLVLNGVLDVPMSPEQRQPSADVPMSPAVGSLDVSMMSPDRGANPSAGAVRLVSDPWDNDLICDLLSALSPPLSSHPRCVSWQGSIPRISPRMTLSMGRADKGEF